MEFKIIEGKTFERLKQSLTELSERSKKLSFTGLNRTVGLLFTTIVKIPFSFVFISYVY
jgi:hypothetical protein